ncbi:NUDIX domain-containing protein [Devosia sp. FKR38]|uniref:NUDIX hydrolase n=1 Tax=Devosia sp. FKR38 TaxID=2562312 RepID=UPI0010C0D003|nr:NUDIX domain-containing protein [Devosia sp. FKR38]
MQQPQLGEPITIALAAIVNSADQMLLVRKAGTTKFMQPGGKIDAGETPRQALDRELLEEIGIRLDGDVAFCGVFEDDATNEPGRRVRGHAFFARRDISATPSAEIEELRWVPLAAPGDLPIAQLSANHIFPLARRMSGADHNTHQDGAARP